MNVARFSAILLAVVLMSVCGCEANRSGPRETEYSDLAKSYIDKLRLGEFDAVRAMSSPEILGQMSDEALMQVSGAFPSGSLLSAEFLGSVEHVTESLYLDVYSFEYQFEAGWVMVDVGLQGKKGQKTVGSLNVRPQSVSLRELHRFSLVDKSGLQYLFLALYVLVPAFVIVTLVVCIRTPMLRHKRFWVLGCLVCVGQVTVIWTSGEFSVEPITVGLLGVGASRSGPFSSWELMSAFPLGAAIFWLRK